MADKYVLSVPVMSSVNVDREQREKTLAELKRCGADRVFVCACSLYSDLAYAEPCLNNIEENVKFFKSHGLEVGVWQLSSLFADDNEFNPQIGDSGKSRNRWRCHAGERLLSVQEFYAKRFAEMGADLIMYDDDFHFGYGATERVRGCFCENHRRLFEAKYGDRLDFDRIKEEFWKEPKNEYREAWMSLTGSTLENFANRMRAAVNEVNPRVRIGFCANGLDYWGNGTTVERLCYAFAGETRPFVRLIGAPYLDFFADYPSRLATILELERLQTEFLKNSGIEVMTEGDTFPRPRLATSAAQLEAFDMIMRADGKSSGILKYMLDYHSTADYETGYIDRHIENVDIYKFIEEHFPRKTAKGVRVYHFPNRIIDAEAQKYGDNGATLGIMPNMACMLAQLSVPTTFEGDGICGAAYGENTKFLDKEALDRGLLTDIFGARVLQDKGIDVGLRDIKGEFSVYGEEFGDGITHRTLAMNSGYYSISIDEKAKPLSYYIELNKWGFGDYNVKASKENPAAYLYENADGQRFCVLAFNLEKAMRDANSLKEGFRSYAKARQIADACRWIGRNDLPVRLVGNHPDVYLMYKEDNFGAAIGVWNLSKDKISNLRLRLDRSFSNANFFGAEGNLSDREISVNTTVYPFEFCGILLDNK